MNKRLLSLVIVFFITCLSLHAQDFPERANPPRLVNDYAKFLNQQEQIELEQKLVAYDDNTSTQISIVTITSIEGYDVADYATQLAQQWEIGQKGKDNGLLILLVKDSRKAFIATGYGLEGLLPDVMIKHLIDEVMVPRFKQGDFYGGLDEVTTAIIQILEGNYKNEHKGEAKNTYAIYVFIFILLAIFVLSLFKNNDNGQGGNRSRGGGLGGGFFPLGMGGGGFSSGGGYSGGSFGGFGGGGFGGGGSGGSW